MILLKATNFDFMFSAVDCRAEMVIALPRTKPYKPDRTKPCPNFEELFEGVLDHDQADPSVAQLCC